MQLTVSFLAVEAVAVTVTPPNVFFADSTINIVVHLPGLLLLLHPEWFWFHNQRQKYSSVIFFSDCKSECKAAFDISSSASGVEPLNFMETPARGSFFAIQDFTCKFFSL